MAKNILQISMAFRLFGTDYDGGISSALLHFGESAGKIGKSEPQIEKRDVEEKQQFKKKWFEYLGFTGKLE